MLSYCNTYCRPDLTEGWLVVQPRTSFAMTACPDFKVEGAVNSAKDQTFTKLTKSLLIIEIVCMHAFEKFYCFPDPIKYRKS